MDLFTHMLVSYLLGQGFGLLSGGVTEPQLLFGVIAGILPDLDVFAFPLWRRLPRLRHHGITHSLLLPAVIALVLPLVVYLFWRLDPLPLIALGLLTGVFHVLSDLLTNFPVPLLAPLSWRGYSFAIDAAVNPYVLFSSLALIVFFWNLRAIGYDYGTFRLMLLAVALLLLLHFSVKLGIKLALRRGHQGEAARVDAEPTFRYLTWYIKLSREVDGAILTEYQKLRLGREARRSLFYEVSPPADWSASARSAAPTLEPGAAGVAGGTPVECQAPAKALPERQGASGAEAGTIARGEPRCGALGTGGSGGGAAGGFLSADAAIIASYRLVRGRRDILGSDDEAAAIVSERPGGGWEVFWFRWWSAYRPPVKGLVVTVLPSGSMEVAEVCRRVEL
ncbi:MAG: metal-dependent hydrolase [Thermoplasmata archaeon]